MSAKNVKSTCFRNNFNSDYPDRYSNWFPQGLNGWKEEDSTKLETTTHFTNLASVTGSEVPVNSAD